MRVIESFIRGKYSDQALCEDGIFIGSKIVAVIDGVTSHGELLWNGGRSGRFAKDVLCEFLRGFEDELAGMSAGECLRQINSVLAEKGRGVHPDAYLDPHMLAEYPRACVVLYNNVAGEVWSYGDCQCLIGDELHCEVKEVDRLMSELRAFVIMSSAREQAACREGDEHGAPEHLVSCDGVLGREFLDQIARHDIGREAVVPLIRKQLWFENAAGSFGYPVLNGVNFAEDMVKVWSVPAGAEVVLASDGYPVLCGTLAESERKLREIIEEDPLCIGVGGGVAGVKGIMEGMESFDDRAFVRVRL